MIGRSSATRKSIFSKPTLTEKLIANAPNLDVHIIPDAGGKNAAYRAKKSEKKKQKCIFGIRSFKKRCHFNFGKLYRNAVQAIGGCRGKYHHGICSRRSCDLGRYKASDLQPDFFYCQRFGFQLFLYQSAVHTSGLRSRISCHLFNYVFGGTAHKLACREVKRACETVCKGGLI